MSFKNVAFAFASIVILGGSARAGDLMDDLAGMDLASINDSAASVEEFDLDSLDVDRLAASAGDDDTDAIEACFRRFGGCRSRGWNRFRGYRSYGYRSFHNCYSYCRPVVRCYTPIVRHYCPVVTSYWGCY